MVSKVSICNLALAQLGQSPISSLEQSDEKARRLKLFYNPVRDEVLRTHNWAFATVQEPLVLLDFPLSPSTETTGVIGKNSRFLYRYPCRSLFIRRIFDPSVPNRNVSFREVFRPDLQARGVACGLPGAWVEYTARVTDESLFDAAFVKCFSLALAADVALALTGDQGLAAGLLQKYTLSLDEARRVNMSENLQQVPQQDAFTEVR